MILKIDMEFEVEGRDEEEAFANLEDSFGRENTTTENVFWDNLEVVE